MALYAILFGVLALLVGAVYFAARRAGTATQQAADAKLSASEGKNAQQTRETVAAMSDEQLNDALHKH